MEIEEENTNNTKMKDARNENPPEEETWQEKVYHVMKCVVRIVLLVLFYRFISY